MIRDKNKYLKILKIEIKSLIKDISTVIDYEKELHDCQKHTHFVYLENLVVLKDEIMGLNGILGQLNKIDVSNSDDIKLQVEKLIKEFVEIRGYPEAVIKLIGNRMQKIEEIAGI